MGCQPNTWNVLAKLMCMKQVIQSLVALGEKRRLMKRPVALQMTTTSMEQFQSMLIQVFQVYIFCFKTLSRKKVSDKIRQNQPGIVVMSVGLLIAQKMGKEVQTVSKIQPQPRLSGATRNRTFVFEDCS